MYRKKFLGVIQRGECFRFDNEQIAHVVIGWEKGKVIVMGLSGASTGEKGLFSPDEKVIHMRVRLLEARR